VVDLPLQFKGYLENNDLAFPRAGLTAKSNLDGSFTDQFSVYQQYMPHCPPIMSK
jgi:hypothetical protein